MALDLRSLAAGVLALFSFLAGCADDAIATPASAPTEPAVAPIAALPSASVGDAPSGENLATTESGFLEVPAQTNASKRAGRLFYVFQSADLDPANKPVFVIFNGGPGSPTTKGLLAFGTGRTTLDGHHLEDGPQPNPASFTRFANLLYLDQRDSGFSYTVGPVSDCRFDAIDDAADHLRAVLRFLAAHPALQKNPVVLLGESFGGARATLMLHLLFHHEDKDLETRLPGLGVEVLAHARAAFPEAPEGAATDAVLRQQFGRQVLIEPLVLGYGQISEQNILLAKDSELSSRLIAGSHDLYNLLEAPSWSNDLEEAAVRTLATRDGALSLGIDLLGASDLRAPSRVGVTRLSNGRNEAQMRKEEDAINPALSELLGPLPGLDRYYVAEACNDLVDIPILPSAFVENLRSVRTFITNARYDGAVYAPAIPVTLARYAHVTEDGAPRAGVDRPGWFKVDLPADPAAHLPATSAEVRFPSYAKSGHMVTASEPEAFAADVLQWLTAP